MAINNAILRPASTLFDAMNECRVTGNHRTAIIVFSQSNFKDLYCEHSRSYASSSEIWSRDYEREGRCRVGRNIAGIDDPFCLDRYDWKTDYWKIDYWYWLDEAQDK